MVPVVSDGEERDKETPQPPAKVTTVDLTLSDDSDDEAPPDLGPPQSKAHDIKTAVPGMCCTRPHDAVHNMLSVLC